MKTKIIILLLAVMASVGSLLASDTSVNGIWYNFDTNNKTAKVTYRGGSYNSYNNEYSGSITIPSTVTYEDIEFSVIGISTYAFRNCAALTFVTIPENVTFIGVEAFRDCTALTSVTIPENVTIIDDRAFYYCTGLTSVTIPNSVTSIKSKAFAGCNGLTSVTIGENVTSISWDAFSGCNGLTSVTWNAKNCNRGEFRTQVETFTFGENVEVIPSYLCTNMTNLTSITIPNSVTSIGAYAFQGCTGLTSFTNYATSPQNISDDVFYNVDKSSCTLYVPCESVDDYQSASYWSNFNSIQGYDCSYTRSTTTGKYGTICIPKAVNAEDVEGGVFFNIVYAVTNTNDEVTGILMEEVTGNLVAGKSYIFRATADELVLTYTGSSVEDPIETTGLVGNLDEDAIDVPQGMYVLSNNQIRKLNGGSATIGQNRAYIDLTSVTKLNYVPAAAPGRIMLYVEDNNPVVTDVRNDTIEKKPVKILRDGMLFIIRDGKTYDMLGNTH